MYFWFPKSKIHSRIHTATTAQVGRPASVNLFGSAGTTGTDVHWPSHAFPFSVCPQLVLSWEMNTQRLIQSADWKESNLKAKVRMSQLGSEFILRQSISQYQPYNISSFKRPLWHFQFSAKHAISPDSCYITRHTISERHFCQTVCKPWLEYNTS